MKYTKQPLEIPQQIQMLRNRGMIIDDEAYAFRQLDLISYFRLAAYWKPMEADKVTHKFKPNSRFESTISLYYFDKSLRTLLFSAIQSIEIALRTKVIHYISLKHGAFWFTNPVLFTDQSLFATHLSHLRTEIGRSREDFIQEHFSRYTTPNVPPVWKTLEVASFGTLSKLLANFADTKNKKQIARSLGIPQHIYLESWLRSLTALRNCIAHHARIWNRRFPFNPQMPKKLHNKWIANITPTNQNLYPLLCVLAYLENTIHPDNNFVADFKALLKKYPNVDTAAMGFPEIWQDEPLWER